MVYVEYQKNRERIAELNDRLRTTLEGGLVLVTRGVEATGYQNEILQSVKEYRFQGIDDNNPYGENDFGKVTVRGQDYYFKIDYYDLALEMHSPDPTDPTVTKRVLTVMRIDEY